MDGLWMHKLKKSVHRYWPLLIGGVLVLLLGVQEYRERSSANAPSEIRVFLDRYADIVASGIEDDQRALFCAEAGPGDLIINGYRDLVGFEGRPIISRLLKEATYLTDRSTETEFVFLVLPGDELQPRDYIVSVRKSTPFGEGSLCIEESA